jgi:hypothetical protein
MINSIAAKLKSDEAAQRRQQVRQGLQNFGSKIQKFNLGKLIDHMEQDQGLADQLESLNEHMQQERERRDICRTAEQACLDAMTEHLEDFLRQRPDVTYEEWIEDFHPENAHDGKLLADLDKEIDLRFYVQESDHRILWNKYHENDPLRFVAARTCMWGNLPPESPVDLLSADDAVPASSEAEQQQGEVDLISF